MSLIKIENLSKKYILAHENSNSCDASLREILSDGVRQIYRKLKRPLARTDNVKSPQEFWALKNISLSIEAGDRIAILGRNGAGKSTLLRLLSRITEPTTGRIEINGTVSSLLEVGTGFHPDLTGRENIILNGAIMGMSSKEMRLKFDEIVAFADVEQFLDIQIKRYSSGMYMRLGFAVAAHLNTELLIVDEVLAVGDAVFQEKCLKKMNEIGAEGKTVIFVSHNIHSILSLCNKGILLEKGELKSFEPIEHCIDRYIRSCPVSGLVWEGNIGDEHIRVRHFSLTPPETNASFYLQNQTTHLNFVFEVVKPNHQLVFAFSITNKKKEVIARSRLCDHPEYQSLMMKTGWHRLSFFLDLKLFHPGEYQIRLESFLINQKKILRDEVILQFSLFAPNRLQKYELGQERDGICLGNNWMKK